MALRRQPRETDDSARPDAAVGHLVSVSRLPEPNEKLGELLLRRDRVSHNQLNEALLQQSASGKRIGALLVELGALADTDLALALAEQFGLESVDLGQRTPEPEAVLLLSESIARTESAIPIEATDK